MKWPTLFFTFLICTLALLPASLHAQELSTTSDTLSLNFGFPILRAQDDLTFVDENENDQIDPDEGCLISFTIKNNSSYPARDIEIVPQELNQLKGIALPPVVKVGNLAPGATRKVEIGVLGQEEMDSGTANFSFLIKEGDEIENTTVVFSVQVNKATE